MKGILSICACVLLGIEGVWGIPFIPYEAPHYDPSGETSGQSVAPVAGTKLALKRSTVPETDTHLEIRRVQAINRAYKKFAKRYLHSAVSPYQIANAMNEIGC